MMPGQGSPASAPPATSPTGQPPSGASPATAPVPNSGLEAAGLARLGLAIKVLESLVPLLGSASPVGKEVMQTIQKLAKHIQPGSVSPGVENSAMQQLMMKQRQQGPQVAAMRSAMMQRPGMSMSGSPAETETATAA